MAENQGRQSRIEEISKSISVKEEKIAELESQFKETSERLMHVSTKLEETIVCLSSFMKHGPSSTV